MAYLCAFPDKEKPWQVKDTTLSLALVARGRVSRVSCLPCKGAKRGCREGKRNERTRNDRRNSAYTIVTAEPAIDRVFVYRERIGLYSPAKNAPTVARVRNV